MNESQNVYFCYVTCPDLKTAEALALKCVDQRLAACANILPNMRSVYIWQDKLEQADEVVLILKTVEAQVEDLQTAIVEGHPYTNPCIVNLPVASGASEYLGWIRSACKPN